MKETVTQVCRMGLDGTIMTEDEEDEEEKTDEEDKDDEEGEEQNCLRPTIKS